MPKVLHGGWMRCRIKSKTPHWIYFHLTHIGSEREFHRAARYLAGLVLRRQIFDVERAHDRPSGLLPIRAINDVRFYVANTFHETAPPISAEPAPENVEEERHG